MKKTKNLTFSAVCSAIIVSLLYLASLVKTGTLSFQYICGLIIMLIASRCGIASGIGVFGVSSVLLFFLSPDKTAAISFTLFFGIFPIIKYFAEKGRRTFEWILKVVFINVFILALYIVFKSVLSLSIPIYVLWIAGIISGIIYDLLLSFGFTFASRYLRKYLT